MLGWKKSTKTKGYHANLSPPSKEYLDFLSNDKNIPNETDRLKNISKRIILPSHKQNQSLKSMCTKRINPAILNYNNSKKS